MYKLCVECLQCFVNALQLILVTGECVCGCYVDGIYRVGNHGDKYGV